MVTTPDSLLFSILPLELWLEIAEDLQPGDFLSLSRTCRQAREGFEPYVSKTFRRAVLESTQWSCTCISSLLELLESGPDYESCKCWMDIPAMIPIRTNDKAAMEQFFNHGLPPSFCKRTNVHSLSLVPTSNRLLPRIDGFNEFNDFQPWSLLSYAIYLGRPHIIRFLLSRGADVQGCYPSFRTIINHHGQLSPLHFALVCNNLNPAINQADRIPDIHVIETLLEYGADPQRVGPWGLRALPFVVRTFPAALLIPFTTVLLAHGADINDTYEYDKTILLGALNRRSSEEMLGFVEFLLQRGANPNAAPLNHAHGAFHHHTFTTRTWTPALQSVISNDVVQRKELMDLLIDYGADINLPSPNGWTPLHHAVYHCNCTTATDPKCLTKLLILRGASTEVYDFSGSSPIDIYMQLSSRTNNSCEFLWVVGDFLRMPAH